MFRTKILCLAAAAALALSATAAQAAVTFNGSFTESHQSADPGLVVQTVPINQNFSFDLDVGESTTVDFFRIYTNEASLDFDDLFDKPITVNMSFTDPAIFGGSVGGTTSGDFTFSLTGFFNLKQNNVGYLSWDNNGLVDMFYGPGNTGHLRAQFDDVGFNLLQTSPGNFAMMPGINGGGVVSPTFTNMAAAVPEPGTWALMITGFGLAGAALRRRQSALGHQASAA